MTTRSEWFRYFVERAGPKRALKERVRTERRSGGKRTVGTPSGHAARKAGYALETSRGKPSRKSTRGSANRQKTDIQFRMKRRVSEGRARSRRP